MSELKKCPFCGHQAKLNINFGRIGISCTNCEANMRSHELSGGEDHITKAWNTRAIGDGFLEALERLVDNTDSVHSFLEKDFNPEHCEFCSSLQNAKDAIKRARGE